MGARKFTSSLGAFFSLSHHFAPGRLINRHNPFLLSFHTLHFFLWPWLEANRTKPLKRMESIVLKQKKREKHA
jgi:hypothetical protein